MRICSYSLLALQTAWGVRKSQAKETAQDGIDIMALNGHDNPKFKVQVHTSRTQDFQQTVIPIKQVVNHFHRLENHPPVLALSTPILVCVTVASSSPGKGPGAGLKIYSYVVPKL